MGIVGSHREDQGEENVDRWTVEDQWDRGTASEDQENRRTHFNWWLLRLDGFFADVLVALEIEITSTSRQQRLGIVSSQKEGCGV
ncbi:unnamed protein product [Caenorhabditis nigoni]